MVTAVDTSVLLTIYKGEPGAERWLDVLQHERAAGRLIACEITVAETAALIDDEDETVRFLQDLGVEFDPMGPRSAILAGSLFKAYRRAGGPRQHLLPDFLIGAHASRQSDQLAAADRGYLRRYFPRLKIVLPR